MLKFRVEGLGCGGAWGHHVMGPRTTWKVYASGIKVQTLEPAAGTAAAAEAGRRDFSRIQQLLFSRIQLLGLAHNY